MIPDRFYPIFDSVAWFDRLLPLGVRFVQLRVKNMEVPDLQKTIDLCLQRCRQHGAALVVNDYWRLAIERDCEWVHLGQEDLDSADIPAIRRAGLRLGISTHDDAELERALSLEPDYIALGPVYPTILKKMKWHEQGLDRLTEWKRRIGNRPLVAIGGMRVERAAGAFAAGADSISVVTDITLSARPEQRVKEWIATTR